ncbi:MAG: hypothetical protein P9X24_05755 [Candidatus Hatepunaea meridiana]|nr:hypothetical protein [Candidatus Hatepunaea meridiana]
MRKYFLFFILSSLIIGCAGQLALKHPIKKQFKSYTLEEVQKVSVGDPIVEVENALVRDAYEALFDYQTPSLGIQGNQQVFLNKGDRFTQVMYALNNPNAVLVRQEGPDKKVLLIHIFPDGRVNRGWCLTDGTVPVQGSWTEERLFQKSEYPSRSNRSFRSQIIYSGLTGNTIKAVYREFSNYYARPAFSQELQYNLDESKMITYRSIKIEIIKATNSYLEFRVVDDGGLPWLPK